MNCNDIEFPKNENIHLFLSAVLIGLQRNPHNTIAEKKIRLKALSDYFKKFPKEKFEA